jgi:hypothetical protein
MTIHSRANNSTRFSHHKKREQPSSAFRRFNKISGQFAAMAIEMLESEAFAVLSLSALRVLFRIEIEHASHGGRENGRLAVTYGDFAKYGIHDHAIAPAIRELISLGFIRLTERGRAGNAEFRTPNRYALTYRVTREGAPATNDWKRFKTKEQAENAVRAARGPVKKPRRKKHFPLAETASVPLVETASENALSPMAETASTGQWRNPPVLSRFSLNPSIPDPAVDDPVADGPTIPDGAVNGAAAMPLMRASQPKREHH